MWNIIFWIFAVIGMITTLVGVVFLIGVIFSGNPSHRNYMKELHKIFLFLVHF